MANHFHRRTPVTVFLPDEGPLFQSMQQLGIRVVSLNFRRLRRYRGKDWLRWYRSMRLTSDRLVLELKQRKINLVHFNDLIDAPYYPIPGQLHLPVLTHLRLILENPIARFLYRWQVRRSHISVLTVSAAVRTRMLGNDNPLHQVLHDPQPDPVVFHPCDGAEWEQRQKRRESLGWGKQHVVVTMVSKMLENKGHLNFCQLAQQLIKVFPEYRFVMIAPPAPDRDEYQNLVRQEFWKLPPGTFHHVTNANRHEVAGWLQASEFFVHFPDTEDSFPSVVLEAMACGTAVVAYQAGGIPEQITPDAGILIEPGEIETATRKIDFLRQNMVQRVEMTNKARKRLQSEFSEVTHFEKLAEIYSFQTGMDL
jgi:glycosyltransferase involved in cell wall biosynthesis